MLSSTQQFIDTLEAKGIKYEINEPTQSGKDVMTVTYSGDRMPLLRQSRRYDGKSFRLAPSRSCYPVQA